MIVNSTDIQNNFGKYILMSAKEDIIITKNGHKVAILTKFQESNESKQNANKSKNKEEQKSNYVNEYSSSYKKNKHITFEEFLEICNNSDNRYEYIDGQIYLLSSPTTTHQRILMNLFAIFYDFFKQDKCTPMIAPYDITLKKHEENINVVQPDIMVICDLEEKLGEDDYYYGVPILVVEIISKSTRSKDYIRKLELYMSCGVCEYWIVDPYNKEAHVYSFKDHDIEDTKTYKENETIKSFYFKDFIITGGDIF